MAEHPSSIPTFKLLPYLQKGYYQYLFQICRKSLKNQICEYW
jgi:hypothetical protein